MGLRHAPDDGLRDSLRPRGFDDAATVLGTDYDGVLVRDGWAPYRRFTHALHQTCLAHLIRRARQLRTDHPRSPWAARVQRVLQAGLDLRDRRDAGLLSDHGLATARGRLLAQLGRLIDKAPTLDAAERFAAHLATEFPAVFGFLWDPSVDATNWRAEQAIRPAVVTRKVCGGNRTRHGADTQQVLASVVRTVHQRHLDLTPLIATILHATDPVVPEPLQRPPPAGVTGCNAATTAPRTRPTVSPSWAAAPPARLPASCPLRPTTRHRAQQASPTANPATRCRRQAFRPPPGPSQPALRRRRFPPRARPARRHRGDPRVTPCPRTIPVVRPNTAPLPSP